MACGKTTLLKIISKQEHASEGEVTYKKGSNVGYLDQIPDFGDEIIVEEFLREAKKISIYNALVF
jgi:ATP-binding cassette, subfamily F, member 3